MDKKKCKVDVEVFLDILQICPRLPNQEFVIPPSSDPEIVSFIKEIRTFSAIINRCLSGKTTGLDKIKLSRAQILWGIFHNNNVDYVKLLWEDFIFQIDNRNTSAARKENMPYPRFTKAIIQHFIYKDKSISMRNRQSMHTVQDDRAATPKKARQFKKPVSPSKKKTLVIVEEPVKKNAKKPTARRQSAGVQIRDTLGVSGQRKSHHVLLSDREHTKLKISKRFRNGSSSGCHEGLWRLIENEEDDEMVVNIWREFIRRERFGNGIDLN
ncbi:hypothetical protein Tco_1169539 [Tanacetum coccineum]